MDEGRYREAERALWSSLGVAPSERVLALERTATEVRVQEVGDGPPVVLVHGEATAGASWAPLVAQLHGFRSIVLDRPGCGLSTPLATTFEDVEALGAFGDALIVDVLDALGLERAHVVATSIGGYLALRGAAAQPTRIERIVLFGWPVGAPSASVSLRMRLGSARWLAQRRAAMPPTEKTVRSILTEVGLGHALETYRISDEELAWHLALLRDTDTVRNDLRAGPRIMTPLRGMNDSVLLPADLLARVQAPVSLQWGDNDPFGGATIAQRFAAQLSNAGLSMWPHTGHSPWVDDPEHAATATRRFLLG